jgi:soluble lytic murein transglycosylase-like protein
MMRNTGAMVSYAQNRASKSASVVIVASDTMSGFMTTVHHTVMILGISAMAALAFMFVNPEAADDLKALSPFNTASLGEQAPSMPTLSNLMSSPMPDALDYDSKSTATQLQQKRITAWLSKRYRVAGIATDVMVSAAYDTAQEIHLDPLLILAVMAIESGFNPFAESPMGAQGLMQVMSKVHREKFVDLGGIKAALNPVANIRVGSLILKDYVMRGGSVEAGLKLYVGAAAFETDSGYGAKVLAEYERLQEVAGIKKATVQSTVQEEKKASSLADKVQSEVTQVAAL